MGRSFYTASIATFLATDGEQILAQLTLESTQVAFGVNDSQLHAWREEIAVLQSQLTGVRGTLHLEFNIPRMGRRIDAVVVTEAVLFVIEFKVGQSKFEGADIEQTWDYALDLKNFHEPSHSALIVPILVATEAGSRPVSKSVEFSADGVASPVLCGPAELGGLMEFAPISGGRGAIDPTEWGLGRYAPTPTIIQAARELYRTHSVTDITRSDAGATNLSKTSGEIERVIREAREIGEHVVCFVTGVPGSGKTLVGLDVATRSANARRDEHSVYLSGNGPLVAVLSEALARDKSERLKEIGRKQALRAIRSEVKAFIQNVHTFRDEFFLDTGPPEEHVAIFDEAQRAWDRAQTSKFLRRRKNIVSEQLSEPDILLRYIGRHNDWCVVVCLVGEGQEINTGESGVGEWFEAVQRLPQRWRVFAPAHLAGHPEAKPGGRPPDVEYLPGLHLSVSLRSYRAESVSKFVQSVLSLDVEGARASLELAARYPIVLTRDLVSAKHWIMSQRRGSERGGLMVSSSAERLKPMALDVRARVDPVHWFLDGGDDTRSSQFLEDAATEFQVQGLELDWACVVWDADLRYSPSGWQHWRFAGTAWRRTRDPLKARYLENAYRVLLTRARQGMVVVVPGGDSHDPTRVPAWYDATFDYLRNIGIPVL